MKKLLATIALAAALVALPLSAADSNQRSITTMGTVNVTIPADSAKLTVSISALEQTLEQSNNRLDATLASFREELKTRGIPAKAVVLKNRDARKEWDNSNYQTRERKFLGYRASVQVIVSIDDISKLSPLITYIGLQEEFGSYPPELRSSKIGAERKAVLASALRTARDKAEIVATEGGAKLGALLNATEEEVRDSYPNWNNLTTNSMAIVSGNDASNSDNGSDSATPTGNHVISINVRIRATFALQ